MSLLSWHFSVGFSPCRSPNMWDASCENWNFSLKKGSFKSSFMTAWSPEWDFFPPESVVQAAVVSRPDISLLYKLTLAAVWLESEWILLREWWTCFALLLCHLTSPKDRFHVKLLILSFSSPSRLPPVYLLCLRWVKAQHTSLWLCIYLSYSHIVIVLLTVNTGNKRWSQCPQNCALAKMWLGEIGQGSRLHSGWWPVMETHQRFPDPNLLTSACISSCNLYMRASAVPSEHHLVLLRWAFC